MFKKETVTLLNTLYRISASEIQMESLKIGTVLERACKKWHKNQKQQMISKFWSTFGLELR